VSLPSGSYTLLAVLDSQGLVTESDETNNVVVLGQFTV
jgi:subtilase family serine protease